MEQTSERPHSIYGKRDLQIQRSTQGLQQGWKFFHFVFALRQIIFFKIYITLYRENLASDYFFSVPLSQIIFFSVLLSQIIFFLKIQHQNIFLGKNQGLPLQVKWSVPKYRRYNLLNAVDVVFRILDTPFQISNCNKSICYLDFVSLKHTISSCEKELYKACGRVSAANEPKASHSGKREDILKYKIS